MTANPDVDFLFTSSDFLYPTIQGVLEPMGKWVTIGDPNHVIMGGLDGDKTACQLMNEKFVNALASRTCTSRPARCCRTSSPAALAGEKQPDAWLDDPGFALTQGNFADRELDMWGCKLFHGV